MHEGLVVAIDQHGFQRQAAVPFRAQDVAPAEGIFGQNFHVAAIQAGDARRFPQADVIPIEQGPRVGGQQVGKMAAAETFFHAYLVAVRHQGHRTSLAAPHFTQVAIQGHESTFIALADQAVADRQGLNVIALAHHEDPFISHVARGIRHLLQPDGGLGLRQRGWWRRGGGLSTRHAQRQNPNYPPKKHAGPSHVSLYPLGGERREAVFSGGAHRASPLRATRV
ncbi:MAG: hypothetical protein COZ24_15095 [Hydrogenophilales bacterium CG_4_10_14_3_um_filter_63_21]|nr:MAG: hypothetical protein COZ24_15095 [Hydrogenophilales bacterium CG_4_10_14_3_um_filter_63_21]